MTVSDVGSNHSDISHWINAGKVNFESRIYSHPQIRYVEYANFESCVLVLFSSTLAIISRLFGG